MSACEQYSKEHEVIASVVKAFGHYIEALERDDTVERQDLARFVTFFRDFADLGHHAKEEDILIPAMVRNGCDFNDGPVAKVKAEHEHERYLTTSLFQAAMQRDPWSRDARRHVSSIGQAYLEFMRGHIAMEEQELLPRANQCLTAAAQADVLREIRQFDKAWNERGEYDWLRQLAAELVQRYAPQLPPI